MAKLKQNCPNCKMEIVFDDRHLGCKARCRTCGDVFMLTPMDLEDSVAGWLLEDVEDLTPPPPSAKAPPVHRAAAPAPAVTRAASAGGSQAGTLPIKLTHVDTMGGFFIFPPSLLYDVGFRSSMPRHCLGCGSTSGLNVHLIVWSSKLPHRDRLRLKPGSAQVRILAETLVRLNGPELLDRLPRVPNMPEPFSLPMPYFVCNRCSPSGQVITHVRPVRGGGEVCELGIGCLKRASEFLAANVGRDSPEYRKLVDEDRQRRDDPWQSLPLAVRNRIAQWYTPDRGERFLAFIRDHDFAPTETGVGGLVLTNRRMIVHKYAAHREIDVHETLQLQAQRRKNYLDLHIGSETVKPVDLHCDFKAPDTLRTALKSLGAHYTYKA